MTDSDSDKLITFQSSRFGQQKVERSAIVHVMGGMIGFPVEIDYVLIEYSPPFYWFHSVQNPNLAFVVVHADEFGEDYLSLLPTEEASLDITADTQIAALVVVTVQPVSQDSTANLKAPIIINTATGNARQVILDNQSLEVKTPLFSV